MTQTAQTSIVGLDISAMLASIDHELEKQREALRLAEHSADLRKALWRALPPTLPQAPSSVLVNRSDTAELALEFRLATADQVLPLLAALPGVPLVQVESGCTGFMPEAKYTTAVRRAHEKVTPIGAVVYRFSHWVSSLQEEFSWWTELDGHLVAVRATTAEGAKTRATARGNAQRIAATDSYDTLWTYENLPKGHLTHWYGGSHRYVPPVTVHTDREVDWAVAMAGSQSENWRVVSDACAC